MVMSRSTAIGSIATGCIMICSAVVAVICGAISFDKLSGKTAASVGLWSLYVFVPGILSIVAGAKKNGTVMSFALFFNITGVIISVVASIIVIITIATLNNALDANQCTGFGSGSCTCVYYGYTYETVHYKTKCSGLDELHALESMLLTVYLLLLVTCFTASIFGCLGTCCAPADQIVVVTTGVPFQVNRGTVFLPSNQSAMHAGYSGQVIPSAYVQSPACGQAQPPAYDQPPAYGQAQFPAYGNTQPPPYETDFGDKNRP